MFSFVVDDNKKIGMALMALGSTFLVLGVLLFLDRVSLACGGWGGCAAAVGGAVVTWRAAACPNGWRVRAGVLVGRCSCVRA